MAREAERLLADTGWLPEPLRLTLPEAAPDTGADLGSEAHDLPDFLAGEDETPADDEDDEQHSVAAE